MAKLPSYSKITIPNSAGVLQFRHVDPNFNKNSYRLAVFVRHVKDDKTKGWVVPVIPEKAPTNIFPLHLRQDVKEYFGGKNPETGFVKPHTLEGFFDLATAYNITIESDLKFSEKPTIMNYYDHKEMRYQLKRIQHIRGLPPLQNINLGEGRARNTDPYNIQTGQVVQFSDVKHGDPLAEKKDVLGVAVSWTGRGTMAIIAILEKGSENSEKIVGIDFCVLDGFSSGNLPDKTGMNDPNWRVRPTGNTVKEPIVGEFDLTAFRFVGYGRLTPRLATFHNKATFDKLVDTILKNMKINKKALGSSSEVQSGAGPDSGPTNYIAAESSSEDKSSVPKYIAPALRKTGPTDEKARKMEGASGAQIESYCIQLEEQVPGVVPTDAY